MRVVRWTTVALAFVGCGSVAVAAAPRAAQSLQALLAQVEPGQWELRDADGGVRRQCVAKPAALVQLMHGTQSCEQALIEGTPTAATVRYACPGHGNGRTVIRVETRQLVTIDTRGVADGQPFDQQFEGRRIGACR